MMLEGIRWSYTIVAAALLAIALGLMGSHLSAWRKARNSQQEKRAKDFAWGQFRRRMQTSAMIALVAIAIFVGQFITSPQVFGPYWLVVLLLLVWLAVLAFVDIRATQRYYGRLRRENRQQLAELESHLRDFERGHREAGR